MATYTYDDGSTITDDGAGNTTSTQSPQGYLVSDYGSNFNWGNLSQGATSALDVLKYGFGRVVDYKTASLQAANRAPQYAPPPVYGSGPGLQLNGNTILLIGGALLLFVIMSGGAGSGKKG